MKIAVLFEHSGTVRDAFTRAGHYAVSFDVLPSETPGTHLIADLTYPGALWDNRVFKSWGDWDLVIAHPPCTHMSVSGNRHHAGTQRRQDSADWIKRVWDIPVERLCIENPVGQINKYIPEMPRAQYIQPHWFGHDASKKTGLWKRNLPDLVPTCFVEPGENGRYENQTASGQNRLGPSPDRWKLRSKFYPGVADAMADQWGSLV